MVTDPYQDVSVATWPPRSSPLSTAPDLPGPAYVVSQVGWRQVLSVAIMPPLLYVSLLRVAGIALPLPRLVNPAILTVLIVLEVALVAVALGRRGHATVVGTTDWVAVRGLLARRWRQRSFLDVDRFSSRNRAGRGRGPMAVVTIADRQGRRLSLTLRYDDPALPALLERLRATGASEVDRRELAPMTPRRTAVTVAAVLVAMGVLIGYLILGPLRLLPPSVAGAFTWSGCRAALAAEGKSPEGDPPLVVALKQASGSAWWLLTTRQADASTFAQRTGDPAARLAHLKADGFLVDEQTYLQNAAGAVVDVQMLRFTTPAGAQAYEAYVNRAVCEQEWQGRSGPSPTEVFLHRGKAAFVRWVGGDYLIEVGQTSSTPFSTPEQIEGIAAALLAGPRSESHRR